ncbi:MAG: type II toxin-antitoxin system VapC family toxin [Rhodoferax sp.]|uniref:type II toxin-antitoxin system VapC family toxin n=1 Tax=Rhodoferax sp. TaxID=50421 RepID=UPI002733708B|nr:type II toxin-antitoxin system VapC family toxin [Rhodoferax sp.]MDP2679114.1 type II toxin-antitoxin system VapC family toxin [Rhodoferax sp.]
MLYVDTSVLVALCTPEVKSADVLKWYAACTGELASAAWCVTEFGSAMGLKQRTGQLTQSQAHSAWLQFERVCANDLQLLPIETKNFHKAAILTMDAATGLRAGEALHLACALDAKAQGIATLDTVMAKNAKRLKLKPVAI